jgi:hypothetical protein
MSPSRHDRLRSVPLAFLASSPVILLVGSVWAHPASEIACLVVVGAFPVALMALGAARGGSLGPVRLPLLVLLVLLVGSMLAMLALRGRVVGGPWIGGLPLALMIQLVAIGVLPLPLVCLAYARSFDEHWLRGDQLQALGKRFERQRPPEG